MIQSQRSSRSHDKRFRILYSSSSSLFMHSQRWFNILEIKHLIDYPLVPTQQLRCFISSFTYARANVCICVIAARYNSKEIEYLRCKLQFYCFPLNLHDLVCACDSTILWLLQCKPLPDFLLVCQTIFLGFRRFSSLLCCQAIFRSKFIRFPLRYEFY